MNKSLLLTGVTIRPYSICWDYQKDIWDIITMPISYFCSVKITFILFILGYFFFYYLLITVYVTISSYNKWWHIQNGNMLLVGRLVLSNSQNTSSLDFGNRFSSWLRRTRQFFITILWFHHDVFLYR